ncbi:hypothetical protein CSTAT_09780 [Corynebacterium stationis]|uniref:IclR family transcriptional regulator n=1 Tax=Corynebacterium stationis TaxID=1705 RepID=UPI0009507BFC|nr:IclR family transcriptional regulator [Corynebacterium stationis]APT95570.1 hypothetical protein CSTAT_09780 [Corynebacterium stationis]
MNRSVVRAMTLLSELGNHPSGITAAELATITGLPRPTVFRLLQTLAYKGMAIRNDKRFSLGYEIARLGRAADPYRGLRSQIQVFIEGLSSELGEATSYSVVEGPAQLRLLAEAQGSYMLSTAMGYVDRDMPLHATAMGKLLLADLTDDQVLTLLPDELEQFLPNTITSPSKLLEELADVRSNDYAVMDNELEEGLFALAVPVRDRSNNLIGVLATSGLDQRMKSTDITRFVGQIREAAQRLLSTIIEA